MTHIIDTAMTRIRHCCRFVWVLMFPFIVLDQLPAEEYPTWELDDSLTARTHGAMGVWNGLLWGLDHENYRIWTYDGVSFGDGGELPRGYKPYRPLFTNHGMFVIARQPYPDRKPSVHLMRSPDGFGDFETLLTFEEQFYSNPLENSIVDLGEQRLLYVDYGNDSSVYYSHDNGDNWNRVFKPAPGSVRHFHGAFYDSAYQKLYLMSGDIDRESSIMVCDKIFGEDGLLENPSLWMKRWGIADASRSTLDENYLLDPDGIVASQRTRAVDMIIDGDYIYWGEDSGQPKGQSVFRAHRESMDVEQIGERGVIGAPWSFLRTTRGDLLFFSASIHYNERLVDGHDDHVRIYAFNEDRTNYAEITRFERKLPFYDTASTHGFVEAFDRVWLYGYEFPQNSLDIVGQLVRGVIQGDYNSNGLLDVADIDLLGRSILDGSSDLHFDLNGDGEITIADEYVWIHDLKNTFVGDANLDGEFNSQDLVLVFIAGQYEDAIADNSGWATGDWDADGDFTTNDLVAAFRDGGYEQGPRPAIHAVPEPTSMTLCALAVIVFGACLRRQQR